MTVFSWWRTFVGLCFLVTGGDLICLTHSNMCSEEDRTHDHKQLPLFFKHQDRLLLTQRNLVVGSSCYPRMCQSSRGIIAFCRRVWAQIEEEIFGQRRKIWRKGPINRLDSNIFQFFTKVFFTWFVARMLTASEQLVGNYTTCPKIDFLRVVFVCYLFWCHVK